MARKDIFYTGSVLALQDDQEEQDGRFTNSKSQASFKGLKGNKQSYASISGLRSNKQSFLSIHRGSLVNSSLALPTIVEGKRRTSFSVRSNQSEIIIEPDGGMLVALKEMMNFKLLKDPLFFLIGVSNFFGMMGFYTPFVYLPNMAAQYEDISVDDASFLISVIGISNTLGRVLSGWISDLPWVNSLVVTNVALVLSALSVFLFPFCASYTSFVILALLFGLFVAAYISLTSIVLVELCGIDNLTSAFGLLTLFRGSSSMIGPPISGMVFEATKSFDISFYASGGFLLIAALTSCLVDVLKRRKQKKLDQKSDE